MAYRFTGFLASGIKHVADPNELPQAAVVRSIDSPFVGVGIALPRLSGEPPSVEEISALASQTGIAAAKAWLFIEYVTWGRVDAVYAVGFSNGVLLGPLDDSNRETVAATYAQAMACIGVSEDDAFDFPPFYRGFWGE